MMDVDDLENIKLFYEHFEKNMRKEIKNMIARINDCWMSYIHAKRKEG